MDRTRRRTVFALFSPTEEERGIAARGSAMGVEAPQWDELLVGIAAGWEVTLRRATMALAEAGLTVVVRAATAPELARRCADRQPHVAVLTLELCQRSHTGGLSTLRRALPRTR